MKVYEIFLNFHYIFSLIFLVLFGFIKTQLISG